MNEDKKLEYQELRDEFALLNQMIATTVNFSVAGCIAIFGYILKSFETSSSLWLFLLPLLIIYPACLLLASRFQAIHRISSYIVLFIESECDLKFQTRLFKLRSKYQGLKFRRMILWIYLALILFDIAIFAFNGFNHYLHFIGYAASLALFLPIYLWVDKGWSLLYDKEWKEVKLDEEKLQKLSTDELITAN